MTRQRAISHLKDISMWGIINADEYYALKMAIKALGQESKTGHWIKSRDSYGNNHFTCPFCENDIATKSDTWTDSYCSNCGAKLSEIPTGSESESSSEKPNKLEQEPKADTWSIKEVAKALEEHGFGRLEQEPKTEWIPVSERLPEDHDWYLIVVKEKSTGYQYIPRVASHFRNNEWCLINTEDADKEWLDDLECIAWCPLPEPYKAESEE